LKYNERKLDNLQEKLDLVKKEKESQSYDLQNINRKLIQNETEISKKNYELQNLQQKLHQSEIERENLQQILHRGQIEKEVQSTDLQQQLEKLDQSYADLDKIRNEAVPQKSLEVDETSPQIKNKEVTKDALSKTEDTSSLNLPVSEDNKSYEATLFRKCWSIYFLIEFCSRFRCGCWFVLFFIVVPPIVYPIICLIEIISVGDEQAPIFKIYLNIYFIAISIFINFVTFSDIAKILGPLHKNNSEITHSLRLKHNENTVISYPNSVNIKSKSYSFVKHICFSWPFTLVFSGLYSFGLPAIHPDYKPQGSEWAFPIIWPIFIVNFMYILYIQLFWIICYFIQEECRFHDFSFAQGTRHISELECMKIFCKNSLNIIVKRINDRLGWFTTSSISLTFCGLLFPVNQYRNLWKNHQLDIDHHIPIMISMFLSLFRLLYSLFRAIKIPLTYNETVKFYSINVGATTEDRTKEFNDKVNGCLLTH